MTFTYFDVAPIQTIAHHFHVFTNNDKNDKEKNLVE